MSEGNANAVENNQSLTLPFAGQLQEPSNESAVTDCNSQDGMDDAMMS